MQVSGLSWQQRVVKRTFDLFLALLGLSVTGWLILLAAAISALDTGENGFFTQQRVGRNGKLFTVIKLRTMRIDPAISTTVTQRSDPRITRFGAFLRKTKIDELPQLVNVLVGDMSFVGPRPDVPGYADRLRGDDCIILSVRPGITGPATLHFRYEEDILAAQPDPEAYNSHVIYPEKVRLNRLYVQDYSFSKDIVYLIQTIIG